MTIQIASNGFGQLLPHRVFEADAQGLPTTRVVEITKPEDILNNVSLNNPIFAATTWPTGAQLPDGQAGNHFFYVTFTQPIDIDSVFDASVGAASSGSLLGTITVNQVDPSTNQVLPVKGRAFIGGKTYGKVDPLDPSRLVLEQWVKLVNGKPEAADVGGTFPGLGFPGTQTNFAGSAILVDPRTFVFVPDQNSNLASHEAFPTGVQIRMRMTKEVRSKRGNKLEQEGVASSTVGTDLIKPEVAVSGPLLTPVIVPGNGDLDVDPETRITVDFTEPIQLPTIGSMDDGTPPSLSSAIQIQFGPSAQITTVPFHVSLPSVFDLTKIELVPAYNFPGSGPQTGGLSCGTFSRIDIIVNTRQFTDMVGNQNSLAPSTFFVTGEGPGLVNAPVTPDAIYIARGGSEPGISVIDLNGFGQGPGVPTYEISRPRVEGNTNYPNNPNVALQGSIMLPPLVPGTCTVDGGSEGVFTMAKDSSLRDKVATRPILESVGDMALGHALDNTFNNGLPFGCQAGGGNICSATGLKILSIGAGGASTQAPSTLSTFPIKTVVGGENPVAWSPHPNPPPLTFPPLCLSPLIGALEPTSIDTTLPPPQYPGLTNLLGPGDPFGQPAINRPPTGLLAKEQNTFFEGPSPPQSNINLCQSFMMRQQVGQFLYVIDRVAGEVVVFNSNRFTVLDRIRMPDPTALAMSPNLDFLAVTSQNANIVSFIDVDPNSASFHQTITTVRVGEGPIGIAWDAGNEDIFVCNQRDNTVSIISAFTFTVRKVLRSQLNSPFEVVITPRQTGFGFLRNVYFAFVLNGDGKLVIVESGPDGLNGWGFDDVIGSPPFTFFNPKTLQPDPLLLNDATVWVVHENQLDLNGSQIGITGGAVSAMALRSGIRGIIPLDPGSFVRPQIRELSFEITASIGPDQLTGIPVDLAFDNLLLQTSLTNFSSPMSAGVPLSINGKSIVKVTGSGFAGTCARSYLFLAVPTSLEGPGVVDVISLSSGFRRFDTNPFHPGVQSVPASGAIGMMDFMRQ